MVMEDGRIKAAAEWAHRLVASILQTPFRTTTQLTRVLARLIGGGITPCGDVA